VSQLSLKCVINQLFNEGHLLRDLLGTCHRFTTSDAFGLFNF